jgi:pyruvate dehydrogenase (quinone)
MACGLPYAMAAALAFPDRQVIAFVGDGGLTMLMGELATCAKYALNVKVVVIKNDSLGQIKWEQMAFLGNPEFGCDLYPIDFVSVARACGIAGYALSDPAQCAAVLREALGRPGPAVIEPWLTPTSRRSLRKSPSNKPEIWSRPWRAEHRTRDRSRAISHLVRFAN